LADVVRANWAEGLLQIELDDPSGFPRLTRAILAELRRLLDTARKVPVPPAIVLTGTDKCFAAGADVAEVGLLDALEALRFSALGQGLMRKIEQHTRPVVAAIRGYCLGGGLDLALACHARVASTDAMFGHPGARLGIITGWGGTQRLQRILGPRGRGKTLEMLASARTITSREAYLWGLVSRVVPPNMVLETASQLAHNAK
jgi:enoyl-CoA hydratase/carnithine racemase